MTKEKFDVWKHFSEWEGWTCNLCGELIESSDNALMRHLKEKHNLEFEDD